VENQRRPRSLLRRFRLEALHPSQTLMQRVAMLWCRTTVARSRGMHDKRAGTIERNLARPEKLCAEYCYIINLVMRASQQTYKLDRFVMRKNVSAFTPQ
jgi:hypothetical protein